MLANKWLQKNESLLYAFLNVLDMELQSHYNDDEVKESYRKLYRRVTLHVEKTPEDLKNIIDIENKKQRK